MLEFVWEGGIVVEGRNVRTNVPNLTCNEMNMKFVKEVCYVVRFVCGDGYEM